MSNGLSFFCSKIPAKKLLSITQDALRCSCLRLFSPFTYWMHKTSKYTKYFILEFCTLEQYHSSTQCSTLHILAGKNSRKFGFWYKHYFIKGFDNVGFLWLQLSVYDAHMSFVVLQTFNNFRTYFFHVCIKKEKCTFAVPHKL